MMSVSRGDPVKRQAVVGRPSTLLSTEEDECEIYET